MLFPRFALMYMFVYNLGIRVYQVLAYLLSLYSPKAQKFVRGRDKSNYLDIPPKPDGQKRVWLHASSLGEFEQGRPVIEKLKQDFPSLSVVLTFFSPSGFEVRKGYALADHVLYLPMDTKANATMFLDKLEPDLALIVKYEFWLHHLDACFQRSIPVVFFSVRFRPGQLYFGLARNFYKKYFSQINHFFVQDSVSSDLLNRMGLASHSLIGDTRFDRVIEISQSSNQLTVVERFLAGKKAIIFGSAWDSDFEKLKPMDRFLDGSVKLIVAPHSIERGSVLRIQSYFASSVLYSEAGEANDISSFPVLVIDNMGMLSSLYRYGNYAFVGGAFRGALHNLLEAAVYGIPVFFGSHPSNQKFMEAAGLVAAGGGFAISGGTEMLELMGQMDKDTSQYTQAARASGSFVHNGAGASDKILKYLTTLVS